MTITQPPRHEVETLIRHQLTTYGGQPSTLALVVPSLDAVKAAIAAGPTAELEVLWAEGIYFMNVIAGKNKATIQSSMKFKTVTLSRIGNLKLGTEGSFSFVGAIRRYDHADFRPHGSLGNIRGYSENRYEISFDPNLHVHSTYRLIGGGQGTELEDEVV